MDEAQKRAENALAGITMRGVDRATRDQAVTNIAQIVRWVMRVANPTKGAA